MVELGNMVRDTVTGFEGCVTCKIEYINGCIQFGVQPKVAEPGKYPDAIYIDHQRLEVIETGVTPKRSKTGGVMRDAPKSADYRG